MGTPIPTGAKSLRCVKLDEAPELIIQRHLADSGNGWSVGTYGAIAEFEYDADEPDLALDLETLSVRTRRGALEIVSLQDVTPLALLDDTGRTREIAFCTTRVGARRTTITELDEHTFDIGIAAPHVDMLVRLGHDHANARAALRASRGLNLFAPGVAAGAVIAQTSPTRILASSIARVEVHQPIPPPGGRSPDGPHTHLLPTFLAKNLDRAPGSPIPEGLYCGLSLYPRRQETRTST
ncbi:MAG: hypothetical protein JSR91_18530 [Proteobacteria bacterium]|nr:hypothetical protein [Pseudomonadota bacterium]